MKYAYGDTVVINAVFVDIGGAPANPATVDVTVKAPDGTLTTPTATNIGVGQYRAVTDGTEPGIWYYRVVGVGNDSDATAEGSFCVEASSI